ncbi:PREDICTED: uncharacterized protein LOC101291029 [Fragaria vesca subsp. vesca]
MEDPETDRNHHESVPSSSSPSTSQTQEQTEQQEQQRRSTSTFSYRVNVLISDVAAFDMKDDFWSGFIVLVTFWFFASMTMILGFFGSADLQLGPNCSRLIRTNPFFVQTIKAQEIEGTKPGSILYGFYIPPPLDDEIAWTETHHTLVPTTNHKEWIYFLNKGSRIDIYYHVKPSSSSPLTLVIAQGRESLVEWIEDPSYGSGKIHQVISESSSYYIAVGNLNPEDVEADLEFNIKSTLYNTSQAYYRCSIHNQYCGLELSLLGTTSAVLTSPGPKEGIQEDDWYVKVSYGPRWLIYFLGSGVMTVLLLMAFRFCSIFQNAGEDRTDFQGREASPVRTPLLLPKDDDALSWGSSYECISNDEEDFEEFLGVSSLEGKSINGGDDNNTLRLCVICFDGPRDCFFLPCGHCATCFTCGTRISEEAGTCPICRMKMKKVRKIFSV